MTQESKTDAQTETAQAGSVQRIVSPLPCPFCGEPGEIRETHRSHFVVQCLNEDCLVHRQPELSPMAAVAVWNERANKLEDDSLMPLGCHKGKQMSEVPASYLFWLWQDCDHKNQSSQISDYIRRNLDALKKEFPDGIWS